MTWRGFLWRSRTSLPPFVPLVHGSVYYCARTCVVHHLETRRHGCAGLWACPAHNWTFCARNQCGIRTGVRVSSARRRAAARDTGELPMAGGCRALPLGTEGDRVPMKQTGAGGGGAAWEAAGGSCDGSVTGTGVSPVRPVRVLGFAGEVTGGTSPRGTSPPSWVGKHRGRERRKGREGNRGKYPLCFGSKRKELSQQREGVGGPERSARTRSAGEAPRGGGEGRQTEAGHGAGRRCPWDQARPQAARGAARLGGTSG